MSKTRWNMRVLSLTLCAACVCMQGGTRAQDMPEEDLLALPEGGHRRQLMSKAADIVKDVLGRFSDANPEEVMGVIQEQFPRRMREFKELSEEHAGEAIEYFTDLVDEARALLEARRQSPELFRQLVKQRRIERAIGELVAACAELEGNARDEKLAELRRALSDAFQVKQAFLKADLAQMEKDVEELRMLVTKREDKREDIVERRLQELIGESQYLEW